MQKAKHFLLFVGLIIFLGSCNQVKQTPIACTKIGCIDGIALNLSSSLPNTAVVEIIYDGQTNTLSCAQGNCINQTVFISNITPKTFTVRISNNGSILSESVHRPTYKNTQPNGPDCPPICKQVEVSINL